MRTILILAAGIWIGREIFTTHFQNQAKEKEQKVRKKLEQFLQENFAGINPREIQKQIRSILK